jgi:nitrite transporter
LLCNMLVCLALWMAARAATDGAKLVVLWWALLAFVASGFEHSVANMTLFALGALDGSSSWAMLARNLLWTIPGNVVGAGLVVGLSRAAVALPTRTAALTAPDATPLAGPQQDPEPAAV